MRKRGIESGGSSIERPPAPEPGSWWEFKVGDASSFAVLGTDVVEGEKVVTIMAESYLKDAAEKGSLVTATTVPLKDFEAQMEPAHPRKFQLGLADSVQKTISLYETRQGRATEPGAQAEADKGAEPASPDAPADALGEAAPNPSPDAAPSGEKPGDTVAPKESSDVAPPAEPGPLDSGTPAPVSSPDTPAERKKELKERIGNLEALVEKNKSAEVEQKKQAYFDALRKYQEERGRLGLMAEGVAGEFASAEVRELRKEWIQARADVARAQLDSVEKRLDERTKDKGLDENEVMERYSRLVTFRSVVMGAEEEEREVRLAALAERERKLDAMDSAEKPWFERVRAFYKRQPPGIRILGTAAIMTGTAALAFGAGPLALAAGASSAGLRWFAEARKSKNPELSDAARGISYLTSVLGVVGATADVATAGYHRVRGTREKAAETLEQRGDIGDLGDVENLEKVSESRKKAANVEENIARDRRRARIAGSVIGGAVLAGMSGGGEAQPSGSAEGNADATPDAGNPPATAEAPAAPAPNAPEATPDAGAAPVAPEAQPAPEGSPSGTTTGAEALVHETPTSPEGTPIATATIDAAGEGTNQLFVDLKQSIRGGEVLSQNPSPALQHLLDANANELSRDMGIEAWNSSANDNGLLTHMGDRIIIDQNQNVWVQQGDNPPQLYLENVDTSVDSRGYVVHTIDPAFESTATPVAAPEAEAVSEPSTAGAAESTEVEPASVVANQQTEGSDEVAATGAEADDSNSDTGSPAASSERVEDLLATGAPAPAGDAAPTGVVGIDEWVREQQQNQLPAEEAAPTPEPLSQWAPGTALPQEASFFKYFELADGKEVFYANGMQPNQFMEFAQQNGIDLRGTVVRFDNPVATFGGMTHQINQIEFGLDGRPASGVEPVLDAGGNPEQYLDTRFLKERIA